MIRSHAGRTFLAVAVLLVAVIAAVMITAPTPQAAAASNCTYYSNASYTTVVGQYGYDCCNNPMAWGKKTRYALCGGCFPCTPPPR